MQILGDGPGSTMQVDPTKPFWVEVRGGSGFSDTGISGLEPGHFDRRNEVHEEAKT